jgi:hypothetical protein
MKQLTIFVNADLEPQVVAALDHAEVDAFLRIGEASGNRFLAQGEVPRTVAWEAVMFLVPALEDEKVHAVAGELDAVSENCGAGLCLKVVATPAELIR